MSFEKGRNLYLPLPEGKLHIYLSQEPLELEPSITHEEGIFALALHIDYIDENGSRYMLPGLTYCYATGEMGGLSSAFFINDGHYKESEIDVHELTSRSEKDERLRISSPEYIKKIEDYFSNKVVFDYK